MIINFLLIIIWHLIALYLCTHLDESFFNPKRYIYSIRKWEKSGAFYTKVLKIKKWKDKLPQYVAKNGFSKKSLDHRLNRTYMEQFIIETCRAEWNHLVGCMYFGVSFLINTKTNAIIFSIIPILINLPFLCIQRFNRIRLYKFMNKGLLVSNLKVY